MDGMGERGLGELDQDACWIADTYIDCASELKVRCNIAINARLQIASIGVELCC